MLHSSLSAINLNFSFRGSIIVVAPVARICFAKNIPPIAIERVYPTALQLIRICWIYEFVAMVVLSKCLRLTPKQSFLKDDLSRSVDVSSAYPSRSHCEHSNCSRYIPKAKLYSKPRQTHETDLSPTMYPFSPFPL